MMTKRILKTVFTVITILAAVSFLQEYVVKPWGDNDERIAGFYMEPEDSLDVVLIGSSEIFHAFSSCQAYRDYGILSYPFACAQNSVSSWRDQVDEVMRTQSPELIVIEINGVLYRDEPLHVEGDLRLLTNNMPVNDNMRELLDSYSDHYKTGDLMSYYFPYLKYHTNIIPADQAVRRALDRLSLKSRGFTYLKGGVAKFSRMDRGETVDLSQDTLTSELDPEYEKVFRDFLIHCREKGYPLLFIRAPHCIRKNDDKNIDRFRMASRAGEIAGEYGYDFIHFDRLHEEAGIMDNDDFTSSEHLNISGMQKFTSYFSGILLDKYISGSREHDAAVIDKWETSRIYYDQYMKDVFREYEENRFDRRGLYSRESMELINTLTKEIRNAGNTTQKPGI